MPKYIHLFDQSPEAYELRRDVLNEDCHRIMPLQEEPYDKPLRDVLGDILPELTPVKKDSSAVKVELDKMGIPAEQYFGVESEVDVLLRIL